MIKQRKIWKWNKQENKNKLMGVDVLYFDENENMHIKRIAKADKYMWLVRSDEKINDFLTLKDAREYAESLLKGGI